MSENRIRKDIDDTLLEKLLSFIKSAGIVTEGKESKKDFLEKLVQETDALQLIEKALNSAGGQTKDLCESIEVFCIKMFGAILEVEELFVSYKNSLLLESIFVICKYTDIPTLSTSILDALLVFSLCIAKHDEGTKWSSERVYMILNSELILTLYKHLIFFLEKLFTFDFFICDTLNLLKKMTALTSKNSFQLPGELKEKLTQLLCKKLLGTRESIVESAVSLAAQIINADYSDWQENIFKYDISSIVWDLAVEGSCDGTVKATAINAITEICMQPTYWTNISSIKGVSEVDVENILLIFSSDQDFLVQREALNCLFKWVRTKWNSESSRMKLFVVLTLAMKSLDLDLKIASLHAWLWLLENEKYFPKLSDATDTEKYLKFLSDSGFGSSVLLAIEDSDEPVQFTAADILMKLRNKLLSLGITKNYKPRENPVETRNSTEGATCNVNRVSKEEKTAGIDSVLSLTTAQQIGNITKITDIKQLYSYKDYAFDLTKSKDVACTVSALWTRIWSDSIDSITDSIEKTDNNNITYALSLLEDIIASEELLSESEDTPDCY
ncbi:uncharacterized protein LOC129220109 [Uloborus diversus]|uniref:uncharacterized protein LOC129220109 n=1 Tax=Uloborus diversus TaxID=327109 RepID=UPI00240A48B1|nr:uncharacterized protein LOC129220109 [Uloborus diversus]